MSDSENTIRRKVAEEITEIVKGLCGRRGHPIFAGPALCLLESSKPYCLLHVLYLPLQKGIFVWWFKSNTTRILILGHGYGIIRDDLLRQGFSSGLTGREGTIRKVNIPSLCKNINDKGKNHCNNQFQQWTSVFKLSFQGWEQAMVFLVHWVKTVIKAIQKNIPNLQRPQDRRKQHTHTKKYLYACRLLSTYWVTGQKNTKRHSAWRPRTSEMNDYCSPLIPVKELSWSDSNLSHFL